MLKRALMIAAAAAALLAGVERAEAQCCDKVCNGDGSSSACAPLVLDGVTNATLTGCNDVGLACVGGQVLPGGGVLDGCGCLLGNCADGSLSPLSASECTAAAVAGCEAGMNVIVTPADPDCVVCGDGICGPGEDDANCGADCGCEATGAAPTCRLVTAPSGCTCGPDCGIRGDCCADACDVCGSCGPF